MLASAQPFRPADAWPAVITNAGDSTPPLLNAAPHITAPAIDTSSQGPNTGSAAVASLSAESSTPPAAPKPIQVAEVPDRTTGSALVMSAENLSPDSVYYADGLQADEPLVPTAGPHINGINGQGDLAAGTSKPIPVPEVPYLWTKALKAQGDQAIFDGWRDALEASVNTMTRQDPTSSGQIDKTLNLIRNLGKLDSLSDRMYEECVTAPDIACWRIMGHVYALQSDPIDAVGAWTKVTQTGMAGAEDWYQLARADEDNQDIAAARQAYNQSLLLGRGQTDLSDVLQDAQRRLGVLAGQ